MSKVSFKSFKCGHTPIYVRKEDCETTSASNKNLYSHLQQQQAELFLEIAKDSYPASRVYLNYRKKFMSIKIELPTVFDTMSQAVYILDGIAIRRSIDIIVNSKGSVIYRIKRVK